MKYLFSFTLALFFLMSAAAGQEEEKSPLEIRITPYLWAPWSNGSLNIDALLRDVQADVAASPIDVLKKVRAAAMLHTDISKGNFVAGMDYIFLLLKSDNAYFNSLSGNDLILSETRLKGNIIEVTVGGRIRGGIVYFDPYVGMRYANFKTEADLTNTMSGNMREAVGTIDFFDALIGGRLVLSPSPKTNLAIKADVGGFKGGSDISWYTEVKGGYAVSRVVDVFAGFKTWSFHYLKEGSDNSLKTNLFGFEAGATIHFPKRDFGDKDTENSGE